MARPAYVLFWVSDPDEIAVVRNNDAVVIEQLATGSARDCLAAAARDLDIPDLHDIRLYVLPGIIRQVAAEQRYTITNQTPEGVTA